MYVMVLKAGMLFLLPALGEYYNQQTGTYNIGLEGMIAMAALFSITVGGKTGNPWIGLLGGIVVAEFLALIHAVLSLSLGVNQALSGLGIWLLGSSLSSYIGLAFRGGSPVVIGTIIGEFTPLFFIGITLIPTFWWILFKTSYGLSVRAIGQDPSVANVSGINVIKTCYIGVLVGGLMAGLSGGYLGLVYTRVWASGMVAGRGWIALTLVFFSMSKLSLLVFGAFLFGALWIVSFRLQTMITGAPTSLIQMIPYLATIAVLAISSYKKRR